MNRDITEGKFDQLKGKVKQSVGETVGNDRLANSGVADQVKGVAKESWGNVKDAAQAASEDTRAQSHRDDARAKIASTAQDVNRAVGAKADEIRQQHKRSA